MSTSLNFLSAQLQKLVKPCFPPNNWNEAKASLVYRADSRTGKAAQSNPESSALNKDSTTDIYIDIDH